MLQVLRLSVEAKVVAGGSCRQITNPGPKKVDTAGSKFLCASTMAVVTEREMNKLFFDEWSKFQALV